MSAPARRHRFTIVEAITAAFILALAAIAFVSMMTMSNEVSDLMDRRQYCMQLAVKRIEQIRNRPFTEVQHFVEDKVRINELGNLDPDGEYWRLTALSDQQERFCTVSVTVFSRGRYLRKPTEYELSTVVIDYDGVHGHHE